MISAKARRFTSPRNWPHTTARACASSSPTRALPENLASTGAILIDIDTALETCPILIVLVDHDVFKSVPLAERADKLVYDTRGIWPDQPPPANAAAPLKNSA